MARLDPGVVLAERFRVEQPVAFARAQPAFLAVDQVTGDKLIAFDVPLEVSQALRAAVGVQHPHLATVRGIVAHEDTDVLLAEYVPGLGVEAFADGAPRLTRVDAVRFILRVLDALLALHNAGAAHGLVRPASVLLDPPEERPRPVLTFAPIPEDPAPYRSPERGASGAPSPRDDDWAAAALLYRLLIGRDPPAQGVASEEELELAGLDDSVLRGALDHALSSDAEKRNADLQPMRRELARWFAEHAGDDTGGSRPSHRPPPPLPPGASQPQDVMAGVASARGDASPSHAPGVSKSMPTVLEPRRKRWWIAVLAAVAVVAGLGASKIVASIRAKPQIKLVETSRSTAATAPTAVSLGEVAVTGESASDGGGDRLASCVAAHLSKDAFRKTPDMAWLCSETDPRAGGEKLKVAVVQGAAGGAPTDAQKTFSQLGWYEMAAFAAIRETCCSDQKPLELPEPSKGCDPLTTSLGEIAKAVDASQSLDEPLAHFAKAAKCETDAKRATLFKRSAAPSSNELAAFKALMKSVQ